MDYTVRPEEHELEAAKRIVEQVLESCRYVLEKQESFEANLGVFSGDFGARGEADRVFLQLYFNPEIEDWRQQLKQTAAHSYGKSWFYEKTERTGLAWQELLAEVTGLMLLEELGEAKEPEKEGLEDEWREKRELLGEEIEGAPMFSWQLKALIGRKLLEENELREFSELTRSDIVEAGDELFR